MRAKIESKPSPIHGNGWFAVEDIEFLEHPREHRPRGHGFNSSCSPNVELVMLKTMLDLGRVKVHQQLVVAIRPIKAGEELTVNYNVVPCNCGNCKTPAEQVKP